MNFNGKTALVTGASVGIGRAVALKLAECGARLVLFDIDYQKLESVKKRQKGIPLMCSYSTVMSAMSKGFMNVLKKQKRHSAASTYLLIMRRSGDAGQALLIPRRMTGENSLI